MQTTRQVIPLHEADSHNEEAVGKVAFQLASLYREGVPLFPGFVIPAASYFDFIKTHKIDHKIKQLLSTVSFDYPETVMQVANHIKKLFYDAPFPRELVQDINQAYERIGSPTVAILSQSHAKNAPGHYRQTAADSNELIIKLKNAWAEHFSAGMLARREEQHIDHTKTGISIFIQGQHEPEKKGYVFTIDPFDHAKDKLIITHQTEHGNDTYVLSKRTLTILERKLARHPINYPTLTLDNILDLGRMAKKIDSFLYFPQQIDWGFLKNKLFMLQTKPFTQLPQLRPQQLKKHAISRGHGVTKTIGTGSVRIINEKKDLLKLQPHDIIVTKHLSDAYLPYLSKVRGVLVENGEKHSAITSFLHRHAVPTLYDVKYATKALKNGRIITIHAGKGEIYAGGFH